MQLTLWFAQSGNNIVLDKTCFVDYPIGSEIIAVRGSGLKHKYGVFRWSPAVQAVSLLFLKHAAGEDPSLEGNSGSYASTLDYALSKQPNWLLDMFGVDDTGLSSLRTIIVRTNSEQKQPGPVRLWLDEKFLKLFSTKVYLNNQELITKEALITLHSAIELQSARLPNISVVSNEKKNGKVNLPPIELNGSTLSNGHHAANGCYTEGNLARSSDFMPESLLSSMSRPYSQFDNFLLNKVIEEAKDTLWATDIFRQREFSARLHQIYTNSFFKKLGGHKSNLLSEVNSQILGSGRFGFSSDEASLMSTLRSGPPIRIAVSATCAAVIGLLVYLRDFKQLNIVIDYAHAETTEMVRLLRNQDFELPTSACVLTIPASTALYSNGKNLSYKPFMVLPKGSHRILARGNSALSAGDLALRAGKETYIFMTDVPGTARYFFEDLLEKGIINKEHAEVMHMDPDEAISALADSKHSFRSISFFPHYHVNRVINGYEFIPVPGSVDSSLETILFLHESLMADSRKVAGLNVAIRDAWLTLREHEEILHAVYSRLFTDTQYVTFLRRCCGIHNIPIEQLNACNWV